MRKGRPETIGAATRVARRMPTRPLLDRRSPAAHHDRRSGDRTGARAGRRGNGARPFESLNARPPDRPAEREAIVEAHHARVGGRPGVRGSADVVNQIRDHQRLRRAGRRASSPAAGSLDRKLVDRARERGLRRFAVKSIDAQIGALLRQIPAARGRGPTGTPPSSRPATEVMEQIGGIQVRDPSERFDLRAAFGCQGDRRIDQQGRRRPAGGRPCWRCRRSPRKRTGVRHSQTPSAKPTSDSDVDAMPISQARFTILVKPP